MLAHRLWSGIISHGPPIDHLYVMLLLQHRVHLCHLLLLLKLPLGRILHMSVEYILNFTCVDLQSSKASVDAVQLTTIRSRLSWLDGWWQSFGVGGVSMSPCCIVSLMPSRSTGLVWLRGVPLARLVPRCEPGRLHGEKPLRMVHLGHKWCRCWRCLLRAACFVPSPAPCYL